MTEKTNEESLKSYKLMPWLCVCFHINFDTVILKWEKSFIYSIDFSFKGVMTL